MMTLDDACKLVDTDTAHYCNNENWMYCGYIVTDGKAFARVDEDFESYNLLPSFIKSTNDADKYLTQLQVNYSKGIEQGKVQLKRDFADFMSVATKDSRKHFDDQLDARIEKLESA